MRHTWLTAIVALFCAFAARDAQDVEWHTDLDSATELSAETGRPLLIVFR